jgi:cytochrome c biogenesis protein CcmG, thiol:disulfide interchange protein DsbE
MSLFLPELERQLREAIRQRSTQSTVAARGWRPRGLEHRSPAGAIAPGVALPPRSGDPNHVPAVPARVRLSLSWGGAATVLAGGSAVVIAVFAIALTGHGRTHGASAARTGSEQARTSLHAQLANRIQPVAPAASLKMPVLGRRGTEDLADLRGRVVVVNLFASWCAPCAAEESVLEQAEKEIVAQNATVLGITYVDSARASEEFVKAHGITYPVLRDVGGEFARAYGAVGIPETYVINREGRVAAIRRYEINRDWLEHTLTALAITPLAPKASRQHVSLANIEPDLMCVACHKRLELAHAPQAVAERLYISSLIARGETKAQIEQTLVRQYGPGVLAKSRTRQPSP